MKCTRGCHVAVVVAALWGTAASAFEVPLANDKFKMSIGGFFYGAAHFDNNGAAPRPWLSVVTARAPEALHFDPFASRLTISAETTQFGAATATETERPRGRGFFEMDWLPAATSPLNGPRIRLMYAQLDAPDVGTVLLGQAWSLMGSSGPDTYNINWFLRQGNPWSRAPTLQLSRPVGPLSVSVGLSGASIGGFGGNTATVHSSVGGTYTLVDFAMPALEARAQMAILEKGFVALAGGFGSMTAVHTPATGGTANAPARATRWIGVLDANAPIKGVGAVSAKVFYARGGGYGTGVGQPMVVGEGQNASAIPSKGGWLSFRLERFQPIVAAAYVAMDDPDDQVAGVNVPTRRNFTFGGHVTYNVPPGGQIALEAMRVMTTRFTAPASETTFTDNKFSLILRYLF